MVDRKAATFLPPLKNDFEHSKTFDRLSDNVDKSYKVDAARKTSLKTAPFQRQQPRRSESCFPKDEITICQLFLKPLNIVSAAFSSFDNLLLNLPRFCAVHTQQLKLSRFCWATPNLLFRSLFILTFLLLTCSTTVAEDSVEEDLLLLSNGKMILTYLQTTMYVECRQTSLKNWLLHLRTAALQAMHYKE
jgi:hypothetical protein